MESLWSSWTIRQCHSLTLSYLLINFVICNNKRLRVKYKIILDGWVQNLLVSLLDYVILTTTWHIMQPAVDLYLIK